MCSVDWKFLLCLKHKFLVDKVVQPWLCMWDHKDILAHTRCTLLSQCIRSKHLSPTVSQMQGSDSGTEVTVSWCVCTWWDIHPSQVSPKMPKFQYFQDLFPWCFYRTKRWRYLSSADKLCPAILFHFNLSMSVKHFRQHNKCQPYIQNRFQAAEIQRYKLNPAALDFRSTPWPFSSIRILVGWCCWPVRVVMSNWG